MQQLDEPFLTKDWTWTRASSISCRQTISDHSQNSSLIGVSIFYKIGFVVVRIVRAKVVKVLTGTFSWSCPLVERLPDLAKPLRLSIACKIVPGAVSGFTLEVRFLLPCFCMS